MNLITITSPSQKKDATDTLTKVILLLALSVAVVAGAVGLAAWLVTPQDDIDATRTAIERAQSAQAEQYATVLFQKAQSDFQSALAEVAEQDQRIKLFRSYRNAEQLLASATGAAIEAREQAVAKRKEIRAARSTIALARIEEKAVSNSLKWATGVFSRTDLRTMKKTLEVLEAELENAEKLFDEEDYVGAKTTADSVLHQTYEISGRIRKAT